MGTTELSVFNAVAVGTSAHTVSTCLSSVKYWRVTHLAFAQLLVGREAGVAFNVLAAKRDNSMSLKMRGIQWIEQGLHKGGTRAKVQAGVM